jgi:hypothetical protein
MERVQRRAFWLYSKIAFTAYRWFPVFGPLRGSIALIRSGGQLLVIERDSDLALSLPGGLARPYRPPRSQGANSFVSALIATTSTCLRLRNGLALLSGTFFCSAQQNCQMSIPIKALPRCR